MSGTVWYKYNEEEFKREDAKEVIPGLTKIVVEEGKDNGYVFDEDKVGRWNYRMVLVDVLDENWERLDDEPNKGGQIFIAQNEDFDLEKAPLPFFGAFAALQSMKIGEHAVFFVEPRLAYGKNGSFPFIPGNALLCFEVKLLALKTRMVNTQTLTNDELQNRPFREFYDDVMVHHEEGRRALARNARAQAIKAFNKGVTVGKEFLRSHEDAPKEEIDTMNKEVATLLRNVGIINFENGKMMDAKKKFIESLEYDSAHFKTHYYLAKIAMSAGIVETAKEEILLAIEDNPKSKPLREFLSEVRKKERELSTLGKEMRGFIHRAKAVPLTCDVHEAPEPEPEFTAADQIDMLCKMANDMAMGEYFDEGFEDYDDYDDYYDEYDDDHDYIDEADTHGFSHENSMMLDI